MVPDVALTEALKEYCTEQGASLVRVADLSPLKKGLPTYPEDLLEPYVAAVSIAVPLNMKAVAVMSGEPTPEYASNCKSINLDLNKMTAAIETWIAGRGYKA